MNESVIRTISSEMKRYLNNYQMSKLNELLYKRLDLDEEKISNEEYLNRFINSKRLVRNNCSNIRNLAIVDLLASSGVRINELVNLNIEDINFEEASKNW